MSRDYLWSIKDRALSFSQWKVQRWLKGDKMVTKKISERWLKNNERSMSFSHPSQTFSFTSSVKKQKKTYILSNDADMKIFVGFNF